MKSRIMVAAGGGGADGYSIGTLGGYGGTLVGANGSMTRSVSTMTVATGATQISGGICCQSDSQAGTNGAFGVGGGAAGTDGNGGGSGGGGGYFGGGGGCVGDGAVGTGSGGSSYISGGAGYNSVTAESTEGSVSVTNGSAHCSGYAFKNVNAEANNNDGNGYATITLVEAETYANAFRYTGDVQSFTVTVSGIYKIRCYGASGGDTNIDGAVLISGGNGAYTEGTIYLSAGTTLYIYVGQCGDNAYSATYNGGGSGGNWFRGKSGGGSTDVRLIDGDWSDFDSLKSRIMVAAGGGGADGYSIGTLGGYGGTLVGANGSMTRSVSTMTVATGATQISGGICCQSDSQAGTNGAFGVGGGAAGTDGNGGGSGGGGSYYGGGGGCVGDGAVGTGGGGSSYISGGVGYNAIANSSTSTEISHTGSSIHYSGYAFSDTTEVANDNDGNGLAIISLEQASEDISVFGYTGGVQSYTVSETGYYRICLLGASGGDTVADSGSYIEGSNGAYTEGVVFLLKGTTIYINVGQSGDGTYTETYNGGGAGGFKYRGKSGGGATDVRLIGGDWNNFDSLKSRIMVAAGGGGADGFSIGALGGYGGTLVGANGSMTVAVNTMTVATGATQTSGGTGCQSDDPAGTNGGFGKGGAASTQGGGSGSGGGGGVTSGAVGTGSGGSSFISGGVGYNAIADSSTSTNIVHTGSSTHYSGYAFSDTIANANVNNGYGLALISFVRGDTTAPTQPTITADRELDNYYNSVSVSFSGSTDAEAGFSHYSYSTDNVNFTNGNSATVASALTGGTEDIILTVRAYDTVGNYSVVTRTFNFDRNNYQISYGLRENGANNAANPSTYNVETSNITFGNPNRLGFTFNGWYKEPTYSTPIAGIPTQSQGNVSAYAKYTLDSLAVPETSAAVNKSYDAETETLTCTPSHAAVAKNFTYQWYKGGSAIQNAITASYTVKNVADSGSYTCAVSVSSDGQSSTATTSPITVAISRRAVTVNANAINKTYGEALTDTFTYQATNVVGGEALAGALSCTPIQAYGTYPITQGSLTNDNNANYNITFNGANYSIAKYALTVTATPISKIYGEELVTTFDYSITEGTLQNSDTALVGALACPTLAQAYGTYPITRGTLTNDNNSNYDISYIGADYSIAKYALTVTATAVNKTYGEELLTTFAYTITEGTLQNNDTALNGALACETLTQAFGTYPITQGTLTNDNNVNYAITYISADYSIAKYALTVTATAINKTYGEELLTVFGYTLTEGELQNNDTALNGALACDTLTQAYGGL